MFIFINLKRLDAFLYLLNDFKADKENNVKNPYWDKIHLEIKDFSIFHNLTIIIDLNTHKRCLTEES